MFEEMTNRLPTLKEFLKPYRKEYNADPEKYRYFPKEDYERMWESYYYETIGRQFMKSFGKEATKKER